jgi:hypothetical protein
MMAMNRQNPGRSRIIVHASAYAALLLCMFLGPTNASSQDRSVVHKPQATLGIQGFLRRLNLQLADYSVELNPGWLVTESKDSSNGITKVLCVDPTDSLHLFLEMISHPADGEHFSVQEWEKLKDQLRAGYGDRKIGTKVLFDTNMISKTGSHGVQAIFEILARLPDRLQFAATVVTKTETILLTADIPNDDYLSKINYFATIVSSVRQRE